MTTEDARMKATAGHTPGPWEWDAGDIAVVRDANDSIIARVCGGATPEEAIERATLIAQAWTIPALRAALEALLEGRPTEEPPKMATAAHRNWELFQQARAALAETQEKQHDR